MADDKSHNHEHGKISASEAGQMGGDAAAKRQHKGKYSNENSDNNTDK